MAAVAGWRSVTIACLTTTAMEVALMVLLSAAPPGSGC
jgi:hypothetical protein